jgi:SAM-dependent methyltransferase
MPQTWNPESYGRDGAFVRELGAGVLEWLAAPTWRAQSSTLVAATGKLTKRIADTGSSVVGIDASPEMVAAARARGIKADNGPAEKLPYPDHTFEAVFSNAVLHWVRGQDEMLSQVRRVLRPGGRFVAEMGGHGNIAAIRVAFAGCRRAPRL